MKTKQQGFTLIELVVVLVLLGILGAVATSRFQNLSAQAEAAATEGVASEIAGGLKLNYAARQLGAGGVAVNGDQAAVCDDTFMENFMTGIDLSTDTDYDVVTAANFDCAVLGAGATFTCTLNGPGAATAPIVGICAN